MTGTATGFLLRLKVFDGPDADAFFDDVECVVIIMFLLSTYLLPQVL